MKNDGLFVVTDRNSIHTVKPNIPQAEIGVTPFSSNRCKSFQPLKTTPFSPQQKVVFNPQLALWLTNNCLYAYTQFCHPEHPIFPPDTTKHNLLYWYNPLPFITKSFLCGFIAQINPLPQDTTNRILISFRGTDDLGEWLTDFDAIQLPINATHLKDTINVHKGFWDTFATPVTHTTPSLQDQLNSLIPQYLKKTEKNEIYLTGHSLGAAVCTLALFDAALRYSDTQLISYTFGSPRVGDLGLVQAAHDLAKIKKDQFVSWRVVNTEDVIANAPPPFSTFGLYSHLPDYLHGSKTPSTFSFTENLGDEVPNHHLVTYYLNLEKFADG